MSSRVARALSASLRRLRVGVLGIVSLVALIASGCGAPLRDASAPYFPDARIAARATAPAGPGLSSNVDSLPPVASRGPVPMPDSALTPGTVTRSTAADLCAEPHQPKPAVSDAVEQAVYAEYRLPWSLDKGKYEVDYLVPVDLGGAQVIANLWPIAIRGLTVHDKSQLDVLLKDAVCQGEITLAAAQAGLESDWYTLWLRFGH